MEFWGVEVKSGAPLKVNPGHTRILHLSQACLGETKDKNSESVFLSVNVDGNKLVLGTLLTDKLPQQQFDLVFDREFEISHSWKKGSVFFYGYKADNPYDEDEFPEEDSDEFDSDDEIVPNNVAIDENPAAVPKQQKPKENEKSQVANDKDSVASKKNVKIEVPKKNADSEEDDDSDDDLMSEDDDDDEDDSDDVEDEDDDEDSDDSDEETPKKDMLPNKKRAAEPSSKTPAQDKKAKLMTPQKTDNKKTGVHVATPHPAKLAGKKTPANKADQQAQKSGGAHSCDSCKRTFGSDKALESHNKAKHEGGK